jgi:hypothetical protein
MSHSDSITKLTFYQSRLGIFHSDDPAGTNLRKVPRWTLEGFFEAQRGQIFSRASKHAPDNMTRSHKFAFKKTINADRDRSLSYCASVYSRFNFLNGLAPSSRHDEDGVAIQFFPTSFEEAKISQSDRGF